MKYCLNFWCQPRSVTVANEDELRKRAEQISKERKTIVSYYKLENGQPQILGTICPKLEIESAPKDNKIKTSEKTESKIDWSAVAAKSHAKRQANNFVRQVMES